MIKHNQTIRRILPTNFLSVFDNFVGLALKELRQNLICTTPEVLAWSCSVKKVFLRTLKNSHENTCVGVTFLDVFFPLNFAKLLKTSFYRTPPAVASFTRR